MCSYIIHHIPIGKHIDKHDHSQHRIPIDIADILIESCEHTRGPIATECIWAHLRHEVVTHHGVAHHGRWGHLSGHHPTHLSGHLVAHHERERIRVHIIAEDWDRDAHVWSLRGRRLEVLGHVIVVVPEDRSQNAFVLLYVIEQKLEVGLLVIVDVEGNAAVIEHKAED